MVRSAAELTQNVGTMGGSHGQSQILDTKGHVLTKGPIFGETLLVQELDLSQDALCVDEVVKSVGYFLNGNLSPCNFVDG